MQERRQKPTILQPGDTVGIIAPSSPFDASELKQGQAILHQMGFATRTADELDTRKGYLAGEDEHRAMQLQAMFTDDGIRAVMCARGGYGAMRIMPLLDFGHLKTCSKAFIGFSDITALHHGLVSQAGLITFHGPTVCSLARVDASSHFALFNALTSPAPIVVRDPRVRVIQSGVARGVVLGGNLATLCHLLATPFAPQFQGCILLLEDTNEAPYRIDRMLTQMRLAGCFRRIAGVVAGSFDSCGPESEIDRLLVECFGGSNIPILAGFPFGHEKCNLTIPLGLPAILSSDEGELRFLTPATSESRNP